MTYHDDSTGEGTDSVTNRGYGSHTANGNVVVHPGKQLSNLKSVCNISSRTLMCELNSAPKNAPKFRKKFLYSWIGGIYYYKESGMDLTKFLGVLKG